MQRQAVFSHCCYLVIVILLTTITTALSDIHPMHQHPSDALPYLDASPEEYLSDGSCTSPLLFFTGLNHDDETAQPEEPTSPRRRHQRFRRSHPEYHFRAAKIYVQGQDNENRRTVQHDLYPFLIHGNRPRKDVKLQVIATPDFCLNKTSMIRYGIWYPCSNPPRDVGIRMVPCVFRPLALWEYHAAKPVLTAPGREARFYIYHHDPDTLTDPEMEDDDDMIDNGDDELDYHEVRHVIELNARDPTETTQADEGDCDSDQECQEEEEAPKYTTAVTCWLPPANSPLSAQTKLNVAEHGYLIQVNGLKYDANGTDLSASRWSTESSSSSSSDPSLDPWAWYSYSVKEQFEVEVNKERLYGRNYCRSVLVIRLAPDAEPVWEPSQEPSTAPVDASPPIPQENLIEDTGRR